MTDKFAPNNVPFYSDIHRYGVRLLQSQTDAEDLVQEVYTRYINSGQKFEGTRLRNWLFRVARNLVIDIIRSRTRHSETPVDISNMFSGQEDSKSDNPATVAEQQDVIQDVLTRLERCEERTREVFRLKFYEGLTSEEIGTKLGIAASTVRKILQQKILKFREAYQ